MSAWVLVVSFLAQGKPVDLVVVGTFDDPADCEVALEERQQMIAKFYKKNPEAKKLIKIKASCALQTYI